MVTYVTQLLLGSPQAHQAHFLKRHQSPAVTEMTASCHKISILKYHKICDFTKGWVSVAAKYLWQQETFLLQAIFDGKIKKNWHISFRRQKCICLYNMQNSSGLSLLLQNWQDSFESKKLFLQVWYH